MMVFASFVLVLNLFAIALNGWSFGVYRRPFSLGCVMASSVCVVGMFVLKP